MLEATGPFIVVVETELTVAATHVDMLNDEEPITAFDGVNATVVRSALYDSQMNKVRTASLTFDEAQWELCDNIANNA